MESTLQKYRRRIQDGTINPVRHWDGRTSGVLIDADDVDTPLTSLSMAAYRLQDGPFVINTFDREYVAVPIDAKFEITASNRTFKGERWGGPFEFLPGEGNACAIYAPPETTLKLAGKGELVLFSTPAAGSRPPSYIPTGKTENTPRGWGVWYREVVTLCTPEDMTTRLFVGETYSPPGLWSGTPLHVHDKDDVAGGQSDHEEIYYHLARHPEGRWGAYGVQLLFDDAGLDKAYMIHHRDAVAIPGAAHPVVAGPSSDMLYVWALTGPGAVLRMADVPEFAYLNIVADLMEQWEEDRPRKPVLSNEFDGAVERYGLTPAQAEILRLHLRERGIPVE